MLLEMLVLNIDWLFYSWLVLIAPSPQEAYQSHVFQNIFWHWTAKTMKGQYKHKKFWIALIFTTDKVLINLLSQLIDKLNILSII